MGISYDRLRAKILETYGEEFVAKIDPVLKAMSPSCKKTESDFLLPCKKSELEILKNVKGIKTAREILSYFPELSNPAADGVSEGQRRGRHTSAGFGRVGKLYIRALKNGQLNQLL